MRAEGARGLAPVPLFFASKPLRRAGPDTQLVKMWLMDRT